MNIRKIIIAAALLLFMFPQNAYADEGFDAFYISDKLGITDLDEAIVGSGLGSALDGFSARDTFVKAARGELGLRPADIMKRVLSVMAAEIGDLLRGMRVLFAIAIIGALFTVLTEHLGGNVGAAGFYVSYLACAALLLDGFMEAVGILSAFSSSVGGFVEAAIPALVSVAAFSGRGVTAAAASPVVFAAAGVARSATSFVVIPLLLSGAALTAAGGFMGRDRLTKFASLIRGVIVWGTAGTAGLFMTVVKLYGITAPAADDLAGKTARMVVSSAPVVGAAFSGAADAALAWAGVVRGGFAVTAVIVIALACAVPVLKLMAFAFAFKIAGALLEPIADEKLADMADGLSAFAGVMAGVAALIGVMFIFMALSILG